MKEKQQKPKDSSSAGKVGSRSKDNTLSMNQEHEQFPFFSSLVDNISLPIIVIGTDLRIKYLNPAASIIFDEKARQNPVGKYCYSFLFDRDAPCSDTARNCPVIECRETGGAVMTDFKLEVEGDFPRYYEIIASPLFNNDGMLAGIVEVFNDITDWKLFERWLKAAREDSENLLQDRTARLLESNKNLRREVQERLRIEMALLHARERLELLYRVIPSAIYTVDLNRVVTSWNDKAETLTGYAREEIVGRTCDAFALYPCTERCGIFSDTIEKPIVGRECYIKRKDGREIVVSKNGDFLRDNEGRIIGAVESFEDITSLKKYEEQLSHERDKLREMLSAIGQGMHILGTDFVIQYQNELAVQIFGNAVGKTCYNLYKQLNDPCEECLMHEAIRTDTIKRAEVIMSNHRQYEISYAPFHDIDGEMKVLSLLRDITEEKLIQAEAMRAVQLASVGELAAGVAHEINNPINGIINYAQIIQDEVADNPVLTEISEKIIREGERIAGIVSNLLSFARQQEDESDQISLYDVVFDAVDLIQHQLSKNCIILEVKLPDNLPPVYGNHHQLQQVFLNLFSNSRYSLNQRYNGKDTDKKIIITGGVITREKRNFVRINFEDHGTGIPEEMVRRIFEPFFSTKTTGEGTGLGLSISKEIIAKHGGSLDVETEEGRFTRMIIDIPVHSGDYGA